MAAAGVPAILGVNTPQPPLFPDQRVLLLDTRITALWKERTATRPANLYVSIEVGSIVPDIDDTLEDPLWKLTARDIHISVDNWNADPLPSNEHRRWDTDAKVRARVRKGLSEMNAHLRRGNSDGRSAPLRCQVQYLSRGGLPLPAHRPEVYVITRELADDHPRAQPRSNVWSFPLPEFLNELRAKFDVLPPAPPLPWWGPWVAPVRRGMIQRSRAVSWSPDWHVSIYLSVKTVHRAIWI